MKVALIDGPNLAYRHYYARVGSPVLDAQGRNISAVVGARVAIKKLRDELAPDAWAMAWEAKGPKARHAMYDGYKAGRGEAPSDLLAQLPWVMNMASDEWNLPSYWAKGEEADDVIATLTELCVGAGHDVVIVSADKDMLQLVARNVTVWCPLPGGKHKLYDTEAVRETWGIPPSMFTALLALMGDQSDGYPGCHGIGRATAVKLLLKYGPTIDHLYGNIAQIDAKWADRLRRGHDAVRISAQLAQLRDGIEGLALERLGDVPRATAELPL